MKFQPGKPKSGGRAPGVPNKFTASFREAILLCYRNLGGDAAFKEWAKNNQTEFYRICARLIPNEMRSNEKPVVEVIIAPANATAQPVIKTVHPVLEDHSTEGE